MAQELAVLNIPQTGSNQAFKQQELIQPERGGIAPNFELLEGKEEIILKTGNSNLIVEFPSVYSGYYSYLYKGKMRVKSEEDETQKIVPVYIKTHTLNQDRFDSPEEFEEVKDIMIREAMRQTALKDNHPGIHIPKVLAFDFVDVIDSEKTQKQVIQVIEGIDGGKTLDQIEFDSIYGITAGFETVAQAIDICHQENIVHGDIKPENLVFDQEGSGWIIDLGNSNIANPNIFMNSSEYTSPEDTERKEHTKEGDIYGFVACLALALTGKRVDESSYNPKMSESPILNGNNRELFTESSPLAISEQNVIKVEKYLYGLLKDEKKRKGLSAIKIMANLDKLLFPQLIGK
ncbi:hypothetical protein IT417_01585 [bacterium]|nr:hypothetical protein [bacterium]